MKMYISGVGSFFGFYLEDEQVWLGSSVHACLFFSSWGSLEHFSIDAERKFGLSQISTWGMTEGL
jgi:hypothetical protein